MQKEYLEICNNITPDTFKLEWLCKIRISKKCVICLHMFYVYSYICVCVYVYGYFLAAVLGITLYLVE